MFEFFKKNFLLILFIIFIIVTILTYFVVNDLKLNENNQKELIKIVTVEAYNPNY